MGQCTSKHGVRKEGAGLKDLNDSKRNLSAINQQTSNVPEDKTTSKTLSSNLGALSSAEETNYSSDFCEEEESFTTADSSSRSMRYPPSRKNSSGISRKTSSVTPSSVSPEKNPSTSTSYLSPSDDKDENNIGSSVSIHDVVKKPGCEMFVIDFEDDISSITSPKKRVPLGCMYNKRQILQSSSVSNSPKKNPKLTIRNDKVSDKNKTSPKTMNAISRRSPSNNKRSKGNKNSSPNTNYSKSSRVNLYSNDKNVLAASNNKNQNSNSKEHSVFKNIINNKKLTKDIVNQKIKSQDSPKHTFLKKKSKNDKQLNVQQKDGK